MLPTCPSCGRPLTKANTWHQCEKVDIADVFKGKSPELLPLFRKLETKMKRWKGLQYSATRKAIIFVHNTSFCIMRPMKAALDIKFYLDYRFEDFPVYKIEPWGKRLGHHIRLHDAGDLDELVFSLLKESYEKG